MQSHNANEHDVERRLSRVESPEPPPDLLGRIRGDIPEHLRPLDEPLAPATERRRAYRLAAASVVLAIVGGFVAYRVFQTAPPPGDLTASFEATPAAEEPSRSSTVSDIQAPPPDGSTETYRDMGAEGARAGRAAPSESEAPTGATPAQQPYPSPARAEARDDLLAEGMANVPDPYARSEDDQPEASRAAKKTEIGPAAGRAIGGDRQRRADEPTPTFRDVVTIEEKMPVVQQPQSLAAAATFDPGPTATPEDREKRVQEVPKPAFAPPPSTGGTAEPNDQPWGDMFFRSYGTNPFVDTEDDPQSTFGLDVDTGSYTVARTYLERGHLPPPEAIRVEEFLNYFDYGDPAPRRGEFTLTAEGAPSPWARGPRYQLLRIGLHGREVAASQRRDATLIFVVDVSGSMARENRIELVKRALHLLLDQLGPGDRVGLVVYGSQGRVLLDPTGDLEAVRRAIDRLATGGSTNAEEGLVLGYDLARHYFRPESINRIVLCSDGVANVGRTGPESILERIGREAEEGIELTTVGFGMGNYNDVLMEQLADRGDGNYAYVDTLAEARRVFVENLTGTLQTIASDAKVQVEFNPRSVTRYRLLGYENRDVADHRFRDDTVDAGEIGAGHRVTALYEIKLTPSASRHQPLAEVRLRYRSVATGQVVEDSLGVSRSDLARSWRSASPPLRLAALAAELAEVLKRSYWARETSPEELRQRARAVARDFRRDDDVAELVRLTERAAALIDEPSAPPG